METSNSFPRSSVGMHMPGAVYVPTEYRGNEGYLCESVAKQLLFVHTFSSDGQYFVTPARNRHFKTKMI